MNRDGSGASGRPRQMDGCARSAPAALDHLLCLRRLHTGGKKRAKEAGGHIVKDKFSIGDYGNIALSSESRRATSSDSIPWPNRPLPFVPDLGSGREQKAAA